MLRSVHPDARTATHTAHSLHPAQNRPCKIYFCPEPEVWHGQYGKALLCSCPCHPDHRSQTSGSHLEANLRVIIVHLIHDERTEYHFYGNLSDLSKKLEDLGFLRVQRSFLVNMEYIVQLQYEKVSLTGGIVLPSSAKNHKELKQHYLLWRGKKRWAIS